MKRFNSIIPAICFIAIASFALCSCTLHFNKRGETDGKQITKTYNIAKTFKGIETKTSVDIVYTISDTVTVKAEGPENIINNLQITIGEDSILHISTKDVDVHVALENDDEKNIINITPNGSYKNLKLYISGPNISSLAIAGYAGFQTNDTMKSDALSVNIAGSGDIDIKGIETNDFKIISKGASEIDIKSLKAETAYFETAGASEIKSMLVDVKKATLSGKGASEVDLDFQNCDEADIQIAGAGEVTLSGTLHKLNKHVAGAGSIDDDRLTIK